MTSHMRYITGKTRTEENFGFILPLKLSSGEKKSREITFR